MYYNNYFDNDYSDDENDLNNKDELTSDIIEELNYDNKISIINFYKDKLLKDPEFIGLKNICSGKILNIIENNLNSSNIKISKNDYKINLEQYYIFNDMYLELNLEPNNHIFNLVTNKIFKIIYL